MLKPHNIISQKHMLGHAMEINSKGAKATKPFHHNRNENYDTARIFLSAFE